MPLNSDQLIGKVKYSHVKFRSHKKKDSKDKHGEKGKLNAEPKEAMQGYNQNA